MFGSDISTQSLTNVSRSSEEMSSRYRCNYHSDPFLRFTATFFLDPLHYLCFGPFWWLNSQQLGSVTAFSDTFESVGRQMKKTVFFIVHNIFMVGIVQPFVCKSIKSSCTLKPCSLSFISFGFFKTEIIAVSFINIRENWQSIVFFKNCQELFLLTFFCLDLLKFF